MTSRRDRVVFWNAWKGLPLSDRSQRRKRGNYRRSTSIWVSPSLVTHSINKLIPSINYRRLQNALMFIRSFFSEPKIDSRLRKEHTFHDIREKSEFFATKKLRSGLSNKLTVTFKLPEGDRCGETRDEEGTCDVTRKSRSMSAVEGFSKSRVTLLLASADKRKVC